MKRTAALAALATSLAPAPAFAAFTAKATPMPPSAQFLVSVGLMAVGGAFVLWNSWQLTRERKRRRAARRAPSPTA